MDLLKKSKPLSDGPTYDCVARSMLMTARSCPPESVCIGILPHRNGILPPVASALAYSPLSCIGCTLSVQGLARIMSMVAVENDNAYKSKLKDGARRPFPTLEGCYTKFASTLRASYSCLDARVAFVNCCPILVSNTAKRVCAMSFFSELLASIVKIFDNSYKLVVISMGAVPKTSVNDMLKSYPNLKTSFIHYNTSDPAQFEHMNVNKVSASEPISPTARENELLMYDLLMYDLCDLETELNIKATFTCNLYLVTTLKIGTSVDGISRLVKALVGHTPDSLFKPFVDRFKQFNASQAILNAVKMDSQMIIAMRARAEVGAAADRTIGDDMGSPAPSSRDLTFRKRNDDQPTLESQQTSQFQAPARPKSTHLFARASADQSASQNGGTNQEGQRQHFQNGRIVTMPLTRSKSLIRPTHQNRQHAGTGRACGVDWHQQSPVGSRLLHHTTAVGPGPGLH
ncbi:unnamed protein product [Cercospora beticola]|nr:unnamed protein product [Cercospora beticola]